jgi:hypothetical protein
MPSLPCLDDNGTKTAKRSQISREHPGADAKNDGRAKALVVFAELPKTSQNSRFSPLLCSFIMMERLAILPGRTQKEEEIQVPVSQITGIINYGQHFAAAQLCIHDLSYLRGY